MKYEGQICRTAMERGAFMLPVAVGCEYNACRFCNLFKHLKYRELPIEQVEAELMRVKCLGGNPKRVFLGDGNAFGMETKRLLTILELVHKYFPACETIKMDATVTNISSKSDDELRSLRAAGICELYLGIESGLDDVLMFMKKDHTLAQAYEQIERLHESDIRYAAHIMTGIAGRGRALENAEATASFFNATRPSSATNFSLFLDRSVSLYKSIEDGTFVPADEFENLLEERRLIESIEVPLEYDGFHDCIEFRVRGTLPRDREKMLASVDEAIGKYQDKEPIFAYCNGLYDFCPECSN